MPNWSSNALIVKSNGSAESDRELANFLERVHATEGQEKTGILNAFVPIDLKLYESGAWYDWCCENWGTKWEVFYSNIEFKADNHLVFETAWSPPMEWLKRVSKEFSTLEFELAFSEQGWARAGVFVINNGKIWSETKIETGYTETDEPFPKWEAHMEKYGLGEGG